MTPHRVRLLDPDRTLVATAQVADEGGYFGNRIDLRLTPAPMRTLFDEFEEVVNGQMFAFLDEVQGKIGALAIEALFDDRPAAAVRDLQVYPSTGDVSFRLAEAPPR